MDHWQVFFKDDAEMNRAKRHQLERVITIFPWIATIDKFQHWIYENPNHTVEERSINWLKILNEFSSKAIDFSGLDAYRSYSWQKQLHLFEVPFYYIEYGIAQLGAIGMWMQYKENASKGLDNYIKALSLGGTKTLPVLYQNAGIELTFDKTSMNRLMRFIKKELESL